MSRKGIYAASAFWGLLLGLLIIQPAEAFSPALRQPAVFLAGHVLGFAVFSFLLSFHFEAGGAGKGRIRNLLLITAVVFSICAFCALFTEFLQYFSPGRTPSWSDFRQDMAGALAGFSVYLVFRFSRVHRIRFLRRPASRAFFSRPHF